MTGYQSPIGSKKFPGQPMRDTVIPDESGYSPPAMNRPTSQIPFDENAIRELNARLNGSLPQVSEEQLQLEEQFRNSREAKRLGRERLGDGARRRIEMLVGMTRTTRNCTIDNNQYVLQSLRDGEMREAVMSASQFDGTVQSPFEIRKQLLARSLASIAGVECSQFFGSIEIEDKLEGLSLFDNYLLGRLYDEYLLMVKEARNKYAIKNEADAKEVVEDLKK